VLASAPPGARLLDVGKSPGGPVRQDEINALLISEGASGAAVVRLKGGDPFVFGRGGEEAEALAEAGIAFEVVPGISSAIAVPAYAGIPVTHRGAATSFTVVTGHSRHAVDSETDWEALAVAGGTIVVLMGVAHRGQIADRLMAGGLDPSTPVAAIRWGSRPEQTTVRVRLDQLGGTPLEPPATIVVGAVVGLDFSWFERRPLFGRRIVVTRARAQASGLAGRLGELGARVHEVPTIAIGEPSDGGAALDAATQRIADYDWVAFSSANSVDAVMSRIPDTRSLGGVKVAAVGGATADALARYRIVADLVPARHDAEGLVESWPQGSGRVLFPRAELGRDVLLDALGARGWRVDLVEAYRTFYPEPGPHDRDLLLQADAVCFTSSSTVSGFLECFGSSAVPRCVVCIGPLTAQTARNAGLQVTVVSRSASVASMVDVLLEVLA
jgi:uroporphyrinogen III methyltransferase/synthase